MIPYKKKRTVLHENNGWFHKNGSLYHFKNKFSELKKIILSQSFLSKLRIWLVIVKTFFSVTFMFWCRTKAFGKHCNAFNPHIFNTIFCITSFPHQLRTNIYPIYCPHQRTRRMLLLLYDVATNKREILALELNIQTLSSAARMSSEMR